jgi:hypothetical protein
MLFTAIAAFSEIQTWDLTQPRPRRRHFAPDSLAYSAANRSCALLGARQVWQRISILHCFCGPIRVGQHVRRPIRRESSGRFRGQRSIGTDASIWL